jgi:hypothetical protein
MPSSLISPEAENSAPEEGTPRDADFWAQKVSSLKLGPVPSSALNLNVQGKHLVGPLQGFGPLWQKTYRVRLSGAKVLPSGVITVWKEHFPEFWPKSNRFYGPRSGIAPGTVSLINAAPGGVLPISTGIFVIYADRESFTFMMPEGHVFASWITFSASEEEDGTMAQVQALLRTNDPIYELCFRLGFSRYEDHLWHHTLKALAAFFDVEAPQVETQAICVDRKMQWSQAKNVWFNAGARTMLYLMATPVRAPVRWWRKHQRHASQPDKGA